MTLSRLRWASALSLALAACSGQAGLAARHARYYEPVFRAQRAHPQAVAAKDEAPPPLGLDSQEAAVIAKTYVRSLAPERARVEETPVLLVSPPDESATPARNQP